MFEYLKSLFKPLINREGLRGRETLYGLGAPVEVYFEERGIPHIFARSEEDLFRAQGYITARDRLFQMDMMRRIASGRLAELYGDIPGVGFDPSLQLRGMGLASLDYLMRTIGIKQAAEEGLSWVSPRTYRALLAYSEGINEWIAAVRKGSHSLFFSYQLLDSEPEEWRPVDSLSVLRLLGFQLSFSWRLLAVFGALCFKLMDSPEKINSLLPPHLEVVVDLDLLRPFRGEGKSGVERSEPSEQSGHSEEGVYLLPSGSGRGSCAWVCSGRWTASGGALLANDPHLVLRLPPYFYQVRLHSETMDVIGLSIPGHPGVYAGHNREIAWGASFSRIDDADIFLEKLDSTGEKYLHDGRWLPLIRREEVIKVRGEATKHRWVRSTIRGPLISDALRGPLPNDLNYSLKWTGQEGVRESEAILQLDWASNWEQFRRAIRYARVPALSFVYADRKGHIGGVFAGRWPVRSHHPRLLHPLPGEDPKYDWQGEIAPEDLPYSFDPPKGIVILSGQDPYSHLTFAKQGLKLQGIWELPHRSKRIERLMMRNYQQKPLAAEQMARLQRDEYCLWSLDFIERELRPLSGTIQLPPPVEENFQLLLKWNGRYSSQSLAAPFFSMFQLKLMESSYLPTLGEDLFRRWIEIANELEPPVEALLRKPESWFKNSKELTVRNALIQAYYTLQKRLGSKPEEWQWEKIHRLYLRPLFFWGGDYQGVFLRGPIGTGGAHLSINTGNFSWTRPFEHRVGAVARLIIDLKECSQSQWILCGGQSESPTTPHYDDQLNLWKEGDLIPICFGNQPVDGVEGHILTPPNYPKIQIARAKNLIPPR